MRKNYVMILLATALAFAGCVPDTTEPVPSQPVPSQPAPAATEQRTSKPLPDNYADPTKPTLVPYYELPDNWEISPSSKTMMRTWEGRDELAMIWLELVDGNNSDAANVAQQMLDRLTCVDGQSRYDNWLQCDRAIEQHDETVVGQTVPHLRYWGTWRGEEQRVDEYYFVYQEKVYRLTMEGGLEEDWQVVKRIIETLELRYEIFVPGVEDEELGGL